MRDSNYKSIANNRAAVTITTSLYDRRALDVTSDKPLVNSLNHLTYLVSSLAKVRETLSVDGGIERLIEILHECHNLVYKVADTVFNGEKKLLTAWKWTLAFQCLVLIGTRGTEEIRQKVVRAGILPILATVLDNYLTLHERTFAHANARPPSTELRQDPRLGGDGPPPTASGSISIANLDEAFHNRQNEADILRSLGPQYLTNQHTETHNQQMSPADAAAAAVAATSISSDQTTFLQSNSLTSDDFESLTTDQLIQLVRANNRSSDTKIPVSSSVSTSVNNDIRRRYLIANIVKKLREDKEGEAVDNQYAKEEEYDMDNGLQFLSNIYLQDERACTANPAARTAPRTFTDTGVIVPYDDDIVWSLQLLAYISKYPYLKDVLQSTHLVIDMSVRDKQLKMYLEKQMRLKVKNHMNILARPTIRPKSRKAKLSGGLERFQPSASNSPQMLNYLNTIDDILDEDKFELVGKAETTEGITEKAEVEDDDDDDDDLEEAENHNLTDEDDRYLAELTQKDEEEHNGQDSYLTKLYDSIIDAESIVNDLEREVALFHISDKINRCIEVECHQLAGAIALKRLEQKEYETEKWDYDTYDCFNIDDNSLSQNDYDESLIEYKTVNLFPIVEKFTFLSGTDMYYWSGVIMRNSCRRNDYRGGVRQCGNLECGRWESYPREFLKCRRCKRTKYCSRECQMRAWHCHRNWCIPSTSSSSSTTVTAAGGGQEEAVARPANLDQQWEEERGSAE